MDTSETSAMMVTPSPNTKRKQKQLGPAPIASIDSIDIPDEVRHRVCIIVFCTNNLSFGFSYTHAHTMVIYRIYTHTCIA